jgi:transcriptional regulator with XRE-family HTH domain
MGKNIGEKIRFMRKQKNMAQYALAKKAGISQSTLSYIEKGSKVPRFETLQTLCRALDTTILELLSHGEDINATRFFNEAPDSKRSALSEQAGNVKPAPSQMSDFERYLYLSYFEGNAQPASSKRFICESEI